MANRKRNEDRERRWRDVLARYRNCGLTVRAFCRQEQLSEPSFYAWRRTLAERDARRTSRRGRPPATQSRQQPGRRPQPPAFLPVLVRAPSVDTAPDLAIELRGGRVLRLGAAISVERLAAIVRALETGAVAQETEVQP